ncbi:unnamed protein product [Acanthosepion pharaonis]|uniref:Uncharacterized protein n=1 Tax=Acanthosepion pharaonis TaxID=158019 RepID=A0A812BE25_ACAPH|nr:unnamed protein product [Sepia pharaonis]
MGRSRRWERFSDSIGQLPPASSWAAPSQLGEELHILLAEEELQRTTPTRVGFAARTSLLNNVEPSSNGSERLRTLCLNTTAGPVTLISVYARTLSATPDTKDEFYDKLPTTISSIPRKEQLLPLDDFNAKVGDDHDSWPSCLGQFGVGKVNDNAQSLLELYTYHNLCIANSFFRLQHKVS